MLSSNFPQQSQQLLVCLTLVGGDALCLMVIKSACCIGDVACLGISDCS